MIVLFKLSFLISELPWYSVLTSIPTLALAPSFIFTPIVSAIFVPKEKPLFSVWSFFSPASNSTLFSAFKTALSFASIWVFFNLISPFLATTFTLPSSLLTEVEVVSDIFLVVLS